MFDKLPPLPGLKATVQASAGTQLLRARMNFYCSLRSALPSLCYPGIYILLGTLAGSWLVLGLTPDFFFVINASVTTFDSTKTNICI